MKKLLSTLAIAAASTALAVESSNTFGILKVTIPAGQQNTVIAAPWCDAGATGAAAESAIKVKDIVKTANLTPATSADNGDKLYVFDGNSYSAAFQLQTVEGVVKWVGIAINDGQAGADETTIQRGQAIVLALNAVPKEAKDIYLYGQYTTVGASTTIAKGSTETPAYTLVAPTGTGDDVVLDATWFGKQQSLEDVAKDMVFIPGKGYFAYVANKGFGVLTPGDFNPETGKWEEDTFTAASVPAGTGFWYISKGGYGSINL